MNKAQALSRKSRRRLKEKKKKIYDFIPVAIYISNYSKATVFALLKQIEIEKKKKMGKLAICR